MIAAAWTKHISCKMEEQNPPAPPPARFERCLPCPCNGGSCRFLTSTKKYAGRHFYRCPLPAAQQCPFFKWADMVEPHELIYVPYCGGCLAGVCRFGKVTGGPNDGRILFTCRVKKGQGSCGFRAWHDELHENASSFTGCDNTGPVIADMVVNCNLISNEEPDNEPHLNDTSINMNIPCLDVTFGKMEQLNCQEDISDELLRTPSKESIAGDKTSFSPPLHLISESKEEVSVNEIYSHSQLTPECNSELSCSTTPEVAVNAPSCAELFSETTPNKFMTDAISKSFALAAEHLQNDLIIRLEVMDFKDHEAMTHASEATFAALKRLFHDYQPLKERVNELIHSAVSLAEVEKSIPDEDSYQCLMDHCHRERIKLGEIDKAHAQVVGTVNKNGKRLIVLQKELSSMKEWISRAEAEIMCCKAEMGNMENQLVEISNKKQILKEHFLVASKEWEENRLKHRERKDVEKSAAKAAFDRARALLRR